jgi:hypothetical protein
MKFITLLFVLLVATTSALAGPVETKSTNPNAENKYWTGSEWVGQTEYDKAAEAFRSFDIGPTTADLRDEINYPPDPSKWMPSEHNK